MMEEAYAGSDHDEDQHPPRRLSIPGRRTKDALDDDSVGVNQHNDTTAVTALATPRRKHRSRPSSHSSRRQPRSSASASAVSHHGPVRIRSILSVGVLALALGRCRTTLPVVHAGPSSSSSRSNPSFVSRPPPPLPTRTTILSTTAPTIPTRVVREERNPPETDPPDDDDDDHRFLDDDTESDDDDDYVPPIRTATTTTTTTTTTMGDGTESQDETDAPTPDASSSAPTASLSSVPPTLDASTRRPAVTSAPTTSATSSHTPVTLGRQNPGEEDKDATVEPSSLAPLSSPPPPPLSSLEPTLPTTSDASTTRTFPPTPSTLFPTATNTPVSMEKQKDTTACASHTACATLQGECCPTPGGNFLSCCSDDGDTPPTPPGGDTEDENDDDTDDTNDIDTRDEDTSPPTPNPPCYLCHDGGASTTLCPSTIIDVPAEFLDQIPVTTVTCGQIVQFAEEANVVPAETCPLLDREDLRIQCCCENVVGAPTAAPTAEETLAPTREPTVGPTEEPTIGPTGEPTVEPTDRPTLPPQPFPTTDIPTERPTEVPTADPTESPIEEPTKSPMEEPTKSPMEEPTEEPTEERTEEPTSEPTRGLTTFPTDNPTSEPTESPTALPTVSPTESPTNAPTPDPTDRPTGAPQPWPTTAPPTASPSLRPSASPSAAPTSTPSVAPSRVPTGQPSISQQPTNSVQPSSAPTDSFEFPKASYYEPGVTMTLDKSRRRRLQTAANGMNCTEALRTEIETRIEAEVRTIIPVIETLTVQVSNTSSVTDDAGTYTFLFDVLIEIRSALQDHDYTRYVEGPFDSQVQRRAFAEFLRTTECPEFQGVTSVVVDSPTDSLKDAESSSTSRGRQSAGLISGLVGAICVILLVAAAFIVVRMRNTTQHKEVDDPDHQWLEGSGGGGMYGKTSRRDDEEGFHDFGSEFGMNTNHEVSTLGDPISPAEMNDSGLGDMSTVGSATVEYDFNQAYGGAHSVAESNVADSIDGDTAPQMTVSTLDDPTLEKNFLPVDDETYDTFGEEQFEVVSPAGLLGLILESNRDDGRPTVNNVKPTSMLGNVVNVGDYLMAVDGQDVTSLKASEVSRLIASKKDAPSRVLLFNRPLGKPSYSVAEISQMG